MIAGIDSAVFRFFNDYFRNIFLDVILPFFSERWAIWLGLGILFVLYAIYCQKRHGESFWRVLVLAIMLGLCVGATDTACNAIKHVSDKARPYQAEEGCHYFQESTGTWMVIGTPNAPEPGSGRSMPSSHAANSMAVALVLAIVLRRTNPWIFSVPLVVGWSRVYLGRHYPIDVLAGWFVGIVSVCMTLWLLNLFFRKLGRKAKQ